MVNAEKIHQAIKESKSHSEAIKSVKSLFENITVSELIDTLEKTPGETVGYTILPALKEKLANQDDFFSSCCSTLSKRGPNPAGRWKFLGCLDSVARTGNDQRKKIYYRTLREIASNKALTKSLRSKSIRLLSRSYSNYKNETINAISKAIASNMNPQMVNAGAACLLALSKNKRRIPQRAVHVLVNFAKGSPKKTIDTPLALKALVMVQPRNYAHIIKKVVLAAKKQKDIAKLVSAIGDKLHVNHLAYLMSRSHDPINQMLFKRVFVSKPIRLKELHKAGLYKEYIYACWLLHHNDVMLSGEQKRISALQKSPDKAIATEAIRLTNSCKPIKLPIASSLAGDTKPTAPRLPAQGFETALQKGDAIYRDTDTHDLWHNHWHAGVFLGFSLSADPTPFSGLLTLIEASGFSLGEEILESGDNIELNQSSPQSFLSPSLDLATVMQQLLNDFMGKFQIKEGGFTFHGPRTTEGITAWQRDCVATTAASFYNQGILYCFAGMLDWSGCHWDGTVGDIDEIRCDGIVEFSYEKQGLKVCEGTDPDKWDITQPGTDHTDSHNDLHNGDYEKGELCPKIQAGNDGADTCLTTPDSVRPTITDFKVSHVDGLNPVFIFFKVSAPASLSVYARLLVFMDGDGEFSFVRTQDLDQLGLPDGDWVLWPCDANSEIMAWWYGAASSDGTYYKNYHNRNGCYLFRLQVIDEGGNVSDEAETWGQINWS